MTDVTNSYLFNNLGHISSDFSDQSQKNIHNTKFANYTISNFFNERASSQYIDFATSYPTMMASGTNGGAGLNPQYVDVDSALALGGDNERPLEKLQLFPRPFLTVPYLGKGAGDPTLESQLQQGESVSDKKSVSTVAESLYGNYSYDYPLLESKKTQFANPANSMQELALAGWERGGSATRDFGYGVDGASNGGYQKPVNRGY
jgi:hypothetical protein